ncbi:MAG: hypothetical protein AAF297_00415 [Planctomycetota bacterium]
MAVSGPGQTDPPRLALVCVPGLSIGGVPVIEDHADRVARPLVAPWPVTDAAFLSTIVTGVPTWRHSVGADRIYDEQLAAARAPNRTDLKSDPVWEVLARAGLRSVVVGSQLASLDDHAPDIEACAAWDVAAHSGTSPRMTTAMPTIDASLNTDAVERLIGGAAVQAAEGPAGDARRRGVAAIRAFERIVRAQALALAALRDRPESQRPHLLCLAITDAGPLFRNPLVDRNRLSGGIAAVCVELAGALGEGGRLILCSAPTTTTARCLSTVPSATSTVRGVCLLTRPPQPFDRVAITPKDIAPSVLAHFGLADAVDLGASDPLGLRSGPAPEPVFTHSTSSFVSEQRAHPESESIERLRRSSGAYPSARRSGERVAHANDAAICVGATAGGATSAARSAARRADATGRCMAVDAVLAFAAADEGDADQLRVRLQRMEATIGETPLLLCGRAIAEALEGRSPEAREALEGVARRIDDTDARWSREQVLPLVAQAAELASLTADADGWWRACAEYPSLQQQSSLGLARLAHAEGRPADCLTHAENALAVDSTNAQANDLAAESLARLGRLDEAIDRLKPRADADPEDRHTRERVGRWLLARGRTNEAAEYLSGYRDGL